MSEVKEHSVIYLSPSDDPEREWCQDDVWEESVRYNLGTDFDRVIAERDALQQRLTAADERAGELLIMLRMAWVDTEVSAENCRRIDAALKPAEVPYAHSGEDDFGHREREQ